MAHCPACLSYTEHEGLLAHCPGCGHEAQIAALEQELEDRNIRHGVIAAEMLKRQCELEQERDALQTKVARLEKLQCEEILDHSALHAIFEVLSAANERHGFIDHDVARILCDRDSLRADLKACAEALQEAVHFHSILACPSIQALLEESQHG